MSHNLLSLMKSDRHVRKDGSSVRSEHGRLRRFLDDAAMSVMLLLLLPEVLQSAFRHRVRLR